MEPFNILTAPCPPRANAREGYRCGLVSFGEAIGATQLGGSVWEIPPGEANARYHYDYADEEWLLVLEGTPVVRRPDGEQQLAPGDVVCFPTGPAGAHSVMNRSDVVVRVVMLAASHVPSVVVYPDDDQILTYTGKGSDNVLVDREHCEVFTIE